MYEDIVQKQATYKVRRCCTNCHQSYELVVPKGTRVDDYTEKHVVDKMVCKTCKCLAYRKNSLQS